MSVPQRDGGGGPSLFEKNASPVPTGPAADDDAPLRVEQGRPTGDPARSVVPVRVLVAVLLVLALLRIAVAAAGLAAGPAESRLAGAAYAMARLGAPLTPGTGTGGWAALQLAGYAGLTGAFGRYADVVGGGRELSVLLCVVTGVALLAVLGRLRAPATAAAALALPAASTVALAALVPFGPGLLAVTWVTVGAALLLRAGPVPRVLGGLAVLAGLVTVPVLAVPVAVLVAAATARRNAPAALVALSLGAAGGVLAALAPSPDTATGPPVALLAVCGVVALAGLAVPGRRALALASLATVVPAALAWSPASVLAPAAVVGAALVASGLVEEAGRRVAHADGRLRVGVLAVAIGLAAVLVSATVTASGPARTAVTGVPAHRALAGWIGSETDPAATFSVPDALRTDLLRDGVPAARLVPGTFAVQAGPVADEPVLARFGSGPATLSVTATAAPTATADAGRARAGAQLAANPDLVAPPDVLAVLRGGGLDDRALVLLAGLTGRGRVVVTALPVVAGEDAFAPRRRVALAAVDPATTDWLRAQVPPFAPIRSGLSTEPLLSWTLPAPPAVFG